MSVIETRQSIIFTNGCSLPSVVKVYARSSTRSEAMERLWVTCSVLLSGKGLLGRTKRWSPAFFRQDVDEVTVKDNLKGVCK